MSKYLGEFAAAQGIAKTIGYPVAEFEGIRVALPQRPGLNVRKALSLGETQIEEAFGRLPEGDRWLVKRVAEAIGYDRNLCDMHSIDFLRLPARELDVAAMYQLGVVDLSGGQLIPSANYEPNFED